MGKKIDWFIHMLVGCVLLVLMFVLWSVAHVTILAAEGLGDLWHMLNGYEKVNGEWRQVIDGEYEFID